MKIIYTRKGEEILVDDEDYDRINQHSWYVSRQGYAVTRTPHPNPEKRMAIQLMHRMVMGLAYGDPRMVDHIHHRKLDNRKSQLRICTNGENMQNAGRSKSNKSGYKGVSFHEASGGMWVARIGAHRKQIYLGIYRTPEEAHVAYCRAADELHGQFAHHGEPYPDAYIDGLKAAQEQAVIAPLVKAIIGGQS